MATKTFTQKELELIRQNPNVERVTNGKITYTLAFKEKAVAEAAQGKMSTRIFAEAGLPEDLIGTKRIYNAMKKFKKEASSPDGLHEAHWKAKERKRERFEKAELEKKRADKAIAALQERIIYLEQEMEFLKKIQKLQHQDTKMPSD